MLESHSPVGAPGEPEVLLWPLLLQVHSTVSPGWIVTDEGENMKPPLPTMTVKVVALARHGQSATTRPMPSTARLIGWAPIALRKTFRKLTLRRNDRRDKMHGVEFADNGLDFRINVFLFPSIGGVWGTVVPHLFGIRDKISRGRVFLDEGLLGFISKQARGLDDDEDAESNRLIEAAKPAARVKALTPEPKRRFKKSRDIRLTL